MLPYRVALILLLSVCVLGVKSQTLIMNEVSQGESGGQEYVEFVVVDSTAVYNCTGSDPPCIDIRGWIIDDNSGYHGTTGIASGACRFSNDLLWSCVPLGTIIVVYNDSDPNVELPADDVSLLDGNCVIVAPISSTALFETNATTPGAAACSYPATGWTPGGTWTNIVMANGGDCFRLVDLAGCEVFSLCWDSDSLNNLIYFPGGATSGVSAANTVYYFNDTDPSSQVNWSIGCADAGACGQQDQTPGLPNNALNAGYIAQFNNGCMPITPIVASATSVDGCGCTGSADAAANGSIPGYSFEWYDNGFVSLGQTTSIASNLCPGTYHVIATSFIGCSDTATVVLNTIAPVNPGIAVATILCSSSSSISLFSLLGGFPDTGGVWSGPSVLTGGYLGDFDPAMNVAGAYTYIVGLSPCQDSTSVGITLESSGSAGVNGTLTMCFGDPATDLFLALNGTPTVGGTWSPALTSGTGLFDPALDPGGVYTYTIPASMSCPAISAAVDVAVNNCCNLMDTVDYDSFEYSSTIPDILPGATFHTTPQNWAVRTGASSVYMNFQNGFQGLVYDRTYDVCVGQTYQFSAWFTNTWGGVPDVDLNLTVYDGTGAIIYQVSSLVVGGPWIEFNTGQFVANTNTIRFELINNIAGGVGNNDCSMDDLVLERCSSPSNDANAGSFCTTDATTNLYAYLLIPLGNGGVWSGPSSLTGGHLGTFDPSVNLSGIYTYVINGGSVCPDSIATVEVVVIASPQLDVIADVSTCNGYQLPAITGINLTGNQAYYDNPGGTGTQYLPGQVLSSSIILYAFDGGTSPSTCFSEEAFNVVISSSALELGNDTTLCDGQTILLDAGSGFDAYLWQDGSIGQTMMVTSAGTYTCEVSVLGSNQVQNGDFELGDNFFSSGYTNGLGGSWGPLSSAGTYEVSTNPQLEHINFMSCSDHTSGSGQMMVVNGSNLSGTNVWCQNIVVTPGTDYEFSTWISNAINDPNVAQLQFSIDGIPLGGIFSTSPTGCFWQEFSAIWNSGTSTAITICISNQNTSGGGNDFMIDDIFFAPICISVDSIDVFYQPPPNAGLDNVLNVCPTDPPIDLFGLLGGTPDAGGNWLPALASGTGIFDPAIDLAGVYTYTASGASICPDANASVDVSLNGLTSATIDPVPGFCITDSPYTLNAVSLGGVWSGSGIVDTLLGIFDPSVAFAGSHEVIYTINGACGSADTVFITVNDNVYAGSDSALNICITDPAIDLTTLVAPADPGGVWIPILASGGGILDPLVDLSTVYQYIISGPGACLNDTASVDVLISPLADASISFSGPFCPSDSPFNLSAAAPGGIWSGTGIVDALMGTFDPAIAGVGIHTISYTISGSCGSFDTELIIVNPEIDPTINPQTDLCLSDGALVLSAINPGGLWSGNGIVNPVTGSFDPSLFGPNNYAVIYTIAGFCPTADTLFFNVLPDLLPVISPVIAYCEDDQMDSLMADIGGGVWSGLGITDSTIGSFDPGMAAVGGNEIIYTISGACAGSDTVLVIVNALPIAAITVSDTIGCPILEVQVDYATSSTLVDCFWSLSDGTIINGCGPAEFSFDIAGCVDLSLFITDIEGCSQTISYSNQICIVDSPIANFEYAPDQINELMPSVEFNNLSVNAVNYQWEIENVLYNSTDVTHVFSTADNYWTCLIAENDIGCIDTLCQNIEIESMPAVYVPNSFTPDGDGTNDFFGPSIYGFEPVNFELMIFNRWGEMIWYSQAPDRLWDGTVSLASGTGVAMEDIYVWKLIYQIPGQIQVNSKVGHVSLLR